MWLATKYGFFSIVRKAPGEYHIRGRVRGDLENLLRLGKWDLAIQCWPGADYRYRIIAGEQEFSELMAMLAVAVDYPNFKDKVACQADQRVKLDAYHQVWALFARMQQGH